MNSAMSLQQSVLMDVASLMNDNRAMKRLRVVLDELKKPMIKRSSSARRKYWMIFVTDLLN